MGQVVNSALLQRQCLVIKLVFGLARDLCVQFEGGFQGQLGQQDLIDKR